MIFILVKYFKIKKVEPTVDVFGCHMIERQLRNTFNIKFNPLTPSRTQVSPFTEISILF